MHVVCCSDAQVNGMGTCASSRHRAKYVYWEKLVSTCELKLAKEVKAKMCKVVKSSKPEDYVCSQQTPLLGRASQNRKTCRQLSWSGSKSRPRQKKEMMMMMTTFSSISGTNSHFKAQREADSSRCRWRRQRGGGAGGGSKRTIFTGTDSDGAPPTKRRKEGAVGDATLSSDESNSDNDGSDSGSDTESSDTESSDSDVGRTHIAAKQATEAESETSARVECEDPDTTSSDAETSDDSSTASKDLDNVVNDAGELHR